MEGGYHFTQTWDTAEQDLMVSSNTRLCLDKKPNLGNVGNLARETLFPSASSSCSVDPSDFRASLCGFYLSPSHSPGSGRPLSLCCSPPLAQTIIALLSLPNLHVFIFLVSAPASLSQESLPIGQIPLLWVVFLVLTCPVCSFLFGDDLITT